MYYVTNYESPLGRIELASNGDELVGMWMENQKYFRGSILEQDIERKDNHSVLLTAVHWLDSYFAGEKPEIMKLPLALIGSEFRKKVWNILCEIPYGATMTYGEIAKRIARESGKSRMSAQAVGGAVGHNPISIIIPCHRVVGTDGSLTGYAGGLTKKLWLLNHEGADLGHLSVPSEFVLRSRQEINVKTS